MFSISNGWIPLFYSCLFVLHGNMGIHPLKFYRISFLVSYFNVQIYKILELLFAGIIRGMTIFFFKQTMFFWLMYTFTEI